MVKDETIVHVRWFDGYLERFECNEVRFGSDLLFLRLTIGQNRHIPLRQVRWYSLLPARRRKSGSDINT